MALTVLEGSTFCVCDERGDVDGSSLAPGLFAADTRFLSRSVLTLGGVRPEPLAHAQPAPHRASFTLRNAVVDGLEPNELSIERERFVGYGMEERIAVSNHGHRRVEVELALELDADFADIFAVKDVDEGFAAVSGGRTLPQPAGRPSWNGADGTLAFADNGFPARTLVHLSRPCEPDGKTAAFPLELGPGERWELVVGVQPLLDGTLPLGPAAFARRILDDRREADTSLEAWQRSTPHLRSPWNDLVRTWDRSLADLAALRMHGDDGFGRLPAAGTPWFMTVFGRDTLITCLQTLVFGPGLAESALRTLAATQATEDDPERDAEPGKIVHEIRRGKAALAWTDRYYGTVDATPLFLILLSEHWRWSGDPSLARELEQPARRALAWIDGPGDRDGDGFVEYNRRARRNGILHQSWKDSEVSMAFSDGSAAVPPIAPAEVQGYVYDAKLRLAELAREVWDDAETAARLERDAAELRDRFDRAFWVGDSGGGHYALGLDRDKRPIDALTSNVGHLLWSGIVPPGRVEAVAAALMGERLWSGWGVRTMAAGERAYNPLVYHNGTVWPHDNSLIAWGLARAGHAHDVERILDSKVEAAAHFDYRLPEVFAGFPRGNGELPIPYPTASQPQAWAAGTPVLLLRLVLGLEPDRASRTLRSHAAGLPAWAESLELAGIGAFGRRWTARVEGGRVAVEESSGS
jgi:glycogen debranching enzyme